MGSNLVQAMLVDVCILLVPLPIGKHTWSSSLVNLLTSHSIQAADAKVSEDRCLHNTPPWELVSHELESTITYLLTYSSLVFA